MKFLKLILPVTVLTLIPSMTECMLANSARRFAVAAPTMARAASRYAGPANFGYTTLVRQAGKEQIEVVKKLAQFAAESNNELKSAQTTIAHKDMLISINDARLHIADRTIRLKDEIIDLKDQSIKLKDQISDIKDKNTPKMGGIAGAILAGQNIAFGLCIADYYYTGGAYMSEMLDKVSHLFGF